MASMFADVCDGIAKMSMLKRKTSVIPFIDLVPNRYVKLMNYIPFGFLYYVQKFCQDDIEHKSGLVKEKAAIFS
jgi:hypothetical protein